MYDSFGDGLGVRVYHIIPLFDVMATSMPKKKQPSCTGGACKGNVWRLHRKTLLMASRVNRERRIAVDGMILGCIAIWIAIIPSYCWDDHAGIVIESAKISAVT